MLRRIVSAAVGIVIGVGALIIDSKILFMVLISAFSGIGAWEIVHAVKCDNHKFLMCFCICFSAFVPFLINIDELAFLRIPTFFVFVLGLLLIMLFGHKTVKFEDVASCGSGALIISASLSCIVMIRGMFTDYYPGTFMVVYTLFCAWFGDSGAYFIGTFFGKHKLCPEISPKKTVEGLIGGIITAGILVAIQCLVYNLILPTELKMNYAVLIPIGMVASGVGVLGDLSASVIKRQYQVKDFGNLIPGHGGVLDRFDSVIFVAPFIYIIFTFLSPAIG